MLSPRGSTSQLIKIQGTYLQRGGARGGVLFVRDSHSTLRLLQFTLKFLGTVKTYNLTSIYSPKDMISLVLFHCTINTNI
jgi:hypothetical protein